MHLWAVVPAFNEEARIAAVVRGLAGPSPASSWWTTAPSDGTAGEATSAGAEVVRQAANGGKGVAIRAGLAAALAHGCTHVLFVDGDGQHRPDDVPALVAAAANGAGLVVGERQFARERMPRSRYYANVVGSRALSWFIGTEVRDTQSGFRIVDADWLRGSAADRYWLRDRDRDAHPARAPRRVRSCVFRSRRCTRTRRASCGPCVIRRGRAFWRSSIASSRERDVTGSP